jgi:hypothetical protein
MDKWNQIGGGKFKTRRIATRRNSGSGNDGLNLKKSYNCEDD